MPTSHLGKTAPGVESAQDQLECKSGKACSRKIRRAVPRGRKASLYFAPYCQCTHPASIAFQIVSLLEQHRISLEQKQCCDHSECKETLYKYREAQTQSESSLFVAMLEDIQNHIGQRSQTPPSHQKNTDPDQKGQGFDLETWIGPRSNKMIRLLRENRSMKAAFLGVLDFLESRKIPFNYVCLLEAITDPDGTHFGKTPERPY